MYNCRPLQKGRWRINKNKLSGPLFSLTCRTLTGFSEQIIEKLYTHLSIENARLISALSGQAVTKVCIVVNKLCSQQLQVYPWSFRRTTIWLTAVKTIFRKVKSLSCSYTTSAWLAFWSNGITMSTYRSKRFLLCIAPCAGKIYNYYAATLSTTFIGSFVSRRYRRAMGASSNWSTDPDVVRTGWMLNYIEQKSEKLWWGC